jgi:hypothetical protein
MKYIQQSFTFVVFPVEDKIKRLEIESKIISTVSLCDDCRPSQSSEGENQEKWAMDCK